MTSLAETTDVEEALPTHGRRDGFFPLSQVTDCLEQVLAASPADETELVWLDRRRGRARRDDPGDDLREPPRLSVLVRVVEGGRLGWFRTESADPHELEDAVRHALAVARAREPLRRRPLLPTDTTPIASPALFDPEVAALDPAAARELLRRGPGRAEDAVLSWSELRLAVANSHGLRRAVAATEVSLAVAMGRRPGAGRAAGSARRLADLGVEAIEERAARRHGEGEAGEAPSGPLPVLLAPEATIELLDLLNVYAFAGRLYLDGTSFLSRHRNVQVFDRAVHLSDDGTREGGLPFPFDLEGTPKRRLELVAAGMPSKLALTQSQGAEAGLPPTAQSVGGRDALFGNLFLEPGPAAEDDLLAAVGDGLAVGWLEPAECYEPTHLRLRAVARGVRRVRDGRLVEPVPDLVWEESLLGALARLRAVGREVVVRATHTTSFGAISAPALVLESADGFRPVG